ncbi:hypothetical protein ACQPXB_21130 [Amycolatopsis sp. CA-161197]|uniref:hypothetical protein n=1 Tax=Amycolatopsis sp. CA-161197 TaxID=3239922 RepID=UPI003D918A48
MAECDPDWLADSALVLDELTSNALMHGGPGRSLALDVRDEDVLVEVSDSSVESARPGKGDGPGELGLRLVDPLNCGCGQRPQTGGKAV